MPTYHYQCQNQECQDDFEIVQKMADAKLTTCGLCGKETLERIVLPAGFILKGGGWFKDGYSDK